MAAPKVAGTGSSLVMIYKELQNLFTVHAAESAKFWTFKPKSCQPAAVTKRFAVEARQREWNSSTGSKAQLCTSRVEDSGSQES
jgi:hypothetical protein